ncbi:hypothetical protein [Actinophytocola xinjiangensis]|uniref:hypothetical protein n=1 Tax=Actinophytocola xinjiangensis TaxID=485602 RepID=UPI000ACF4536|nr:hypothetical protein [Actinophytocola xinjiangensis]
MGSWVQVGSTVGIGLCAVLLLQWALFIGLSIWSMATKCADRRKHALALIGLLRRVGPPLPRLPKQSGPASEGGESPDDASDDA